MCVNTVLHAFLLLCVVFCVVDHLSNLEALPGLRESSPLVQSDVVVVVIVMLVIVIVIVCY